jgi:hypothetical protein
VALNKRPGPIYARYQQHFASKFTLPFEFDRNMAERFPSGTAAAIHVNVMSAFCPSPPRFRNGRSWGQSWHCYEVMYVFVKNCPARREPGQVLGGTSQSNTATADSQEAFIGIPPAKSKANSNARKLSFPCNTQARDEYCKLSHVGP